MPRVSAWMVRFSLVYFMVGFTLGALLLSNKAVPFLPILWNFLPVHVELLVTGWMIQFTLGIAFWIFPRFKGGMRGNEKTAWLAAFLLNAGLILSITAYLQFDQTVIWIGRGLEAAGPLILMSTLWKRVKPLPGQN